MKAMSVLHHLQRTIHNLIVDTHATNFSLKDLSAEDFSLSHFDHYFLSWHLKINH